jgi:hypothetical protein
MAVSRVSPSHSARSTAFLWVAISIRQHITCVSGVWFQLPNTFGYANDCNQSTVIRASPGRRTRILLPNHTFKRNGTVIKKVKGRGMPPMSVIHMGVILDLSTLIITTRTY